VVRFVSFRASVIVPLLRQVDDWLEQAVHSAINQSVPTEVLVVRSEATPASNCRVLDRLGERHDNLVVLVEDRPGSFPNAINTGVRHARTDRIGLLLSDDWLDATAVAECLEWNTDIVSTGNNVYFPDGRLNEAACTDLSMAGFHARPTLEAKARYLQHFFLFRKDALLRVGGLDESIGNYPGIDDFDLIWTLLEHDASVSIVEKRLYHYRDHHGERLTLADPKKRLANLEKILRKHGVSDADHARIVSEHAPWFGRPIYQVMQDQQRSQQDFMPFSVRGMFRRAKTHAQKIAHKVKERARALAKAIKDLMAPRRR
jgi:glycosyltransferase involved in cell wall biosynthesis